MPGAVHPLRRVAALLMCAGVAVSAVGCGTPGPAANHTVDSLVGPHPQPPQTGPTAAQITRFHWSWLAGSPLGPRSQPVLAWAGNEMLELGGAVKDPGSQQGAAFVPATGRWHRIAAAGGKAGFANAVSAWTGRQLFVADGQFASCQAMRGRDGTPAACWPHAGLYDPAANHWTMIGLPEALSGSTLSAAVWTGQRVVLAGVNASHGRLAVAAYDPATGRWQVITPVLPPHHPSATAVMAVAGGRLILWSMWNRVTRSGTTVAGYFGVDVFAWNSGGWRDVTGAWPQNQIVTSPVAAGRSILVSPGQIWCGFSCSPPSASFPGYFADPVTLARTMIPAGPLGQTDPAFVWTGRAIIAVNLYAEIGNPGGSGLKIRPDDMALWDPAIRRWLGLPGPPGYPGLAAAPIWTGTELLALTNGGQLLAFHH